MLYLIPPRKFWEFNDLPNLQNAHVHRSSYSITENDKESKLQVDFPGAKPEDVAVTLENDALAVKNESQDFSKFFAFDTSKTDVDKVVATLHDGVLTVVAPKLPKPEPLTIPLSPDPVVNNDKESSLLSLDLPGVKAGDVNVSVDSSFVVVEASRNVGGDLREFRKIFEVDDTTHDLVNAKACLHHGVLSVYAPLKPKAVPIDVPVATEEGTTLATGEDMFHFTVDMPGVKVADVSVQVDRGVLRTKATRTFSTGKAVRLSKAVDLDKRVKVELLKAELVDGVLSVTAPREPLPAPRTIAVMSKPPTQMLE